MDGSVHIVGIDGGGTFTDVLVLHPGGRLSAFKVPSTPDQPADAIMEGLELAKLVPGEAGSRGEGAAAPRRRLEVSVGTTIATNTVLEGKGARVAFVTTRGFRDILEIGRQKRPGLYDPSVVRPPLLVGHDMLFEVSERTGPGGEVVIEPDPQDCIDLTARLRALGVESVALCTLFSFMNPQNERKIAVHLGAFPLSVSSDLLPRMREYERASTTVLDAYVKPTIWNFVGELVARASTLPDEYPDDGYDGPEDGDGLIPDLDSSLGHAGELEEGVTRSPVTVHLMRSSGGVAPLDTAIARPGELLLSGPAGGVLGAAFLAGLTGEMDLLCLDMGGTSADISVITGGQAHWTGNGTVGRYPLALPMVDVVTIGAGGGSIAANEAGILTVGPRSAGAFPGPMCYGMGGKLVTVTDVNVYTGRIGPSTVLGERVPLRADLARRGLEELASSTGMGADRTAVATLDVVNTRMAHAARGVLSSRGLDPKDFTLLAFGGGGPLHACALARELDMGRVVVPFHPGVFSSLGIMLAGVKEHFTRPLMVRTGDTLAASVAEAMDSLVNQALEQLGGEPSPLQGSHMRFSADIRYVGQSFEINMPLEDTLAGGDGAEGPGGFFREWPPSPRMVEEVLPRFHDRHRELYGHSLGDTPVEFVALNLECLVPRPPVEAARSAFESALRAGAAGPPQSTVGPRDERDCLVGSSWTRVKVWDRASLSPDWIHQGPMVIEEPLCTTFVDAGWDAAVDEFGSIVMTRRGYGEARDVGGAGGEGDITEEEGDITEEEGDITGGEGE